MMDKIDLNQVKEETVTSRLQSNVNSVATRSAIATQVNRNLGRNKKEMKKNQPWLYLIPVVVLLGAFLAGNFIFKPQKKVATQTTPEPVAEDTGLLDIDASAPRDQICPLNGVMYTQAEKDAWSTRRPLAVMIENTPDARPQSGLSYADIVFEAVAEGGITRFMPIFYCGVQNEDVTLAPIRSARTYYINLASGFNRPMYVHVGGANFDGTPETHALNQLSDYGWTGENDINQFSVGYPTFIRDYNRVPGKELATEHTMTTSTEKLWAVAEKRGWTNMSPELTVGRKTIESSDWLDGYTGWTFVDGAAKGSAQTVSYSFWSGMNNYDVKWQYDPSTNLYTRYTGGNVHTDLENGEAITASDVIVMFAKESGPLNEVKHMMYDVIGKGDAIIFHNGAAEEITWSKKTRESELEFFNEDGDAIEMTRGKIWVSVLAIGTDVTY